MTSSQLPCILAFVLGHVEKTEMYKFVMLINTEVQGVRKIQENFQNIVANKTQQKNNPTIAAT